MSTRLTGILIVLALSPLPAAAPHADNVYLETFETGADGWTVVRGASYWRVSDGRYVFDDPGWSRYITVAPVQIVDGTVTVRAEPLAKSPSHGWAAFGVMVKYINGAEYAAVRFGAYNGVTVYKMEDGEQVIEHIGKLDAEVGREYRARLEIDGSMLTVFLDGDPLEPVHIGFAGRAGRVGLYTETPAAFDEFRVHRAEEFDPTAHQHIDGTPKPSVEFATFQPDPLAPGEALPVRGQLHLYLCNSGDGPAVLESVGLDGRDGDALVENGTLAWYHQHPHRIRPGEIGRVTLRVNGIQQRQALALMSGHQPSPSTVTVKHLKAEPVDRKVRWGPNPEPLRINILTFGPKLRTVTAYLQARAPADGGYDIQTVTVNGQDMTAHAQFGSRTIAAAIVPVQISLDEPLTRGRHVTVTVTTEQGVSCGHCLRAFESRFPLQVCLFDLIREDAFEDIRNHCFTTVAPRKQSQLPELDRLGFDILPFGGPIGLGGIMRWWRESAPPIPAFWLDERDKHPVANTMRPLREAHDYFRRRGRYIPPQMINLLRPWSGTGMAFMDILDIVCHAYGMSGAINSRDFPLLSTLPWRELRAARRPWWPYFRSAELAIAVDTEKRRLLEPAETTQRVIEPAQERMMTYGCIQLGAKGICHWAYGVRGGDSSVYYLDGPGLRLSMGGVPYPASRSVYGYKVPEDICRSLKATWDEIGRINAELQTIGPWLADSDVSSLARVAHSEPQQSVTGGPAAQAAALISGLDTIILVALNLNIDTDWSGRDPEGIRSYEPVDATIELRLPPWVQPKETFSVGWRGIQNVTPTLRDDRLLFHLPHLAIQKVIVITADPAVRTHMQNRIANMQKHLHAMENHTPRPSRDP